MKKIIFATAFLVALTTASYAGGNEVDGKLLNNLKSAFKNASDVKWSSSASYSKASFSWNNQLISAFFDTDNELVGFGRYLAQSDLPQAALETIQKKYSGYVIDDAMLFIDNSGHVNYFAAVKDSKHYTALKISVDGRVQVYSQMPS